MIDFDIWADRRLSNENAVEIGIEMGSKRIGGLSNASKTCVAVLGERHRNSLMDLLFAGDMV